MASPTGRRPGASRWTRSRRRRRSPPARPTRPTRPRRASPSRASPARASSASLDGGSFAACTSPQSYSGLADGSHTFDGQGDRRGRQHRHRPSLQLDGGHDAAGGHDRHPPGRPDEQLVGELRFHERARRHTSSASSTAAASPAAPARRATRAWATAATPSPCKATDAAGNTGAPASFTWTVDTTAPAVTIDTRPSDPTSSTDASFAFLERARRRSFECQLDGGGFTACTSPESYSAWPTAATPSHVEGDRPGRQHRHRQLHLDDRHHRADGHDRHAGPNDPTNSDRGQLRVLRRRGRARASSAASTAATTPTCTSPEELQRPRRRQPHLHRQGHRRRPATPAPPAATPGRSTPPRRPSRSTSQPEQPDEQHRAPASRSAPARPARASSAASTAATSPPAPARRATPASPTAATPSTVQATDAPATPAPPALSWTVDTVGADRRHRPAGPRPDEQHRGELRASPPATTHAPAASASSAGSTAATSPTCT